MLMVSTYDRQRDTKQILTSYRLITTSWTPEELTSTPTRQPLRHQMHRFLLQIHRTRQLHRSHSTFPRHTHHSHWARNRSHNQLSPRTPIQRHGLLHRHILTSRAFLLFSARRTRHLRRKGRHPQTLPFRPPALSALPKRPPPTWRCLVRRNAARKDDPHRR